MIIRINFNGRLTLPETLLATVYNRSLRYGDGLFETMYWDGFQIRNDEFHLDRLFQGLQFLQFDLTAGFTRSYIFEEIKRLCVNNASAIRARVRLNVYREDGEVLRPEENKPVFIIESAPLPDDDEKPLRLTVYQKEKKFAGQMSNLKTNNYLLNILALQYAVQNGFDESLILNHRGDLCEAVSSNLVMMQRGILLMPALTEGCVAGTKRRELLETLPSLGYEIKETIISPAMLPDMEEIFLTNAIRGIRPVSEIDGHGFSSDRTRLLMRIMNKTKE